ncbi:hypothetical protein [Staphylococcus haemolyticus]|uniref:hypothetical protein n=1 Tax=Staphylococcus haemolyticus TaxID=1283 RepID=UPI0034D75E63
MKKSFFMHTYNVVFTMLYLFGISYSLISALTLMSYFMEGSEINEYINIRHYVHLLCTKLQLIGIPALLILIILVLSEIINRLIFDSFILYLVSIIKTKNLKKFLYQKQIVDSNIQSSNSLRKTDPTIKEFNKTMRKTVLDVRRGYILICIKIPYSQQAQKLLFDMKVDIINELKNTNDKYYFSEPIRSGNKLWITGKRKGVANTF